MYKKFFIVFIFLGISLSILLTKNLSKTSVIDQNANILYGLSLAYDGPVNEPTASERSSGSAGGGLGMLIVFGVQFIIEYTSNDINNTYPCTPYPTCAKLSNVLSPETKSRLNSSSLSESKIFDLIKAMTGLSVIELTDNSKKSIYLGTMEDRYNSIAEENNGIAFYNEGYKDLLTEIGADNMWLINSIVIEYAIFFKWNIFLVSNPDLYYNKTTMTVILPERGYGKELFLIHAINKKNWRFIGPYWKVIL